MPSTNNGQGSGEGTGNVNPDKAIARLLYAMLKQKSLKDIDWNQVACDPALLEEISNGHAARMRYSRFRTTVENQTKCALGANKEATPPQKASKPKAKGAKAAKRPRNKDSDLDHDTIKAAIKTEAAADEENGPALDLEFNLDGALPENKTTAALEDLTNTSFSSSLPSPPTESVPSMADSLALLERKKKMRKMYSFSPTMKAQTLHQIPLPRSALSQTPVGAIRVHSFPTISTAAASPTTATTPVNLSGALMMRHHSAGSLVPELNAHHQQQAMRQARMLTPNSDIDHHQYHAHHANHTQLSLPADNSASLDAAFDFTFGSNTAAAANVHHRSSTAGHPSPWVATPFSSPPAPTFDMSPYATTLDLMGGGVGSIDPDESHSMPSLFQTQLDTQQQKQQDAINANYMAYAFTKHGSWDAMLG